MPDLTDIVSKVVSWADSDEQIEAYAAWDRELAIRVYEGEIEQLTSAESSGIGIRVIRQGKQGFSYAGTLDDASLAEVLQEARDNASFATSDEFAGLTDPDGVMPVELDLWRDGVSSTDTSTKIAMALDLEKQIRDSDKRIRQVESANYADVAWEAAVASTSGVRAQGSGTGAYLHAYAIAQEDGDVRTGGGYSVGREPSELSVEEASSDSVTRATRLLGAVKPRSGRMVAIFDPRISASLLSIVAGTLSGEAVEKGRSLFTGRLGEQVADSGITIVENPTDARAYMASRFDAEGLASRKTILVEGGILLGYLYDSYSARRAGTRSTASACRGGYATTPGVGFKAISCTPGERSQSDII
ncbi:MAG TPA: TldD/PmbA family protein, partial [Acidimicrobiales bacterium]|nr:TldD/PmbA family protein [Acidimicrobiales bacterium]